MKKFFIAIVAVVTITSCSTMKETQRTILTSFSDYRQYAAEGFLISPSPYTYDFESVGEIDIVVEPAMVKVVKSQYYNYETLVYETIPYDELVKMAVDEAKAKGADALVNFTITKEYVRDTHGLINEMYYNITGFCIKRK